MVTLRVARRVQRSCTVFVRRCHISARTERHAIHAKRHAPVTQRGSNENLYIEPLTPK
jgi:hypothetical protein